MDKPSIKVRNWKQIKIEQGMVNNEIFSMGCKLIVNFFFSGLMLFNDSNQISRTGISNYNAITDPNLSNITRKGHSTRWLENGSCNTDF